MAGNQTIKESFHALGIPDSISDSYESMGLKSLFEWQRECLEKSSVLKGKNLLYTAATGSGKSLIAELVLCKTAVILNKISLFVLPYVSLIKEKEAFMKKLLRPFKDQVSIAALYGVKSAAKVCNDKTRIIICTIEKANIVVNILLAQKQAHHLGLCVIDECHCIGDSFSGALAETMISKLLLLNAKSARSDLAPDMQKTKTQFVLLTATLGHGVEAIRRWLGPNCAVFASTYRPVTLIEHVVSGRSVFLPDGVPAPGGDLNCGADQSNNSVLKALVMRALDRGQQVLLFCSSKNQCRSTCSLLQSELQPSTTHAGNKTKPEDIKRKREKAVEALKNSYKEADRAVDESLLAGVMCGVGYHHSDVTGDGATAIEKAYKEQALSVLCCTTSIAVGVNLPAGCVIVASMRTGADNLTSVAYRQRVGREIGRAHV
jgi:replicative superfamily II helicase